MDPPLSTELASRGINKKKLSKESKILFNTLLNIYIKEILMQANNQAKFENCDKVMVAHLEKVLPRVLMDF
jgi:hypothetical protein